MKTQDVIKIGENFKIGEAVITPAILLELETLQSDDNYMLKSDRAVIADSIAKILMDMNENGTPETIVLISDLASIYNKLKYLKRPTDLTATEEL
ncbi:hypothetical protein [Gaoshiqia sediminis]|uniref:Uncharacterized protein n=1 Tax=Gaoshiqia sediminis TaxID=2986998 RepID=A0AA42C637_9BACT|nr:hypothetical protein [Gaoshiqia sediminis]MCW0483498.1 hypothetical protein [Gaoshiqia sediminis]